LNSLFVILCFTYSQILASTCEIPYFVASTMDALSCIILTLHVSWHFFFFFLFLLIFLLLREEIIAQNFVLFDKFHIKFNNQIVCEFSLFGWDIALYMQKIGVWTPVICLLIYNVKNDKIIECALNLYISKLLELKRLWHDSIKFWW
jgi:hypothetical protein